MQEVCNKCEGTGAGLMLECSKCDGIGYVYGDAVLSDLEIVHKALTKTNYEVSSYENGWYLARWSNDLSGVESAGTFSSVESLLTWAKKTLEQSS